jgi:hypothetical protein
MSIGSSAGRHGDWSVQGAMTQGDVAAWMVSGAYVTRAPGRHVYDTGMSYSLQRYDGSNPAALAAVADGNRYAAVLYAYDAFTISRKVTLLYGGRYAKYGYLDDSLFSPARTPHHRADRIAACELRRGAPRVAPGAEEFVPSMVAGNWVPPERTFAPITGTSFVPERTNHFDVSMEHDLTPTTLVAVRSFYQDTEDQLVTLFGLGNVERPAADLGHYYVGSAGDVSARGWTVSVRQVIAQRLRGSVDYTVSTAQWQETPQSDIVSLRPAGRGAPRSRADPGCDGSRRHRHSGHRDARVRALPGQHGLRGGHDRLARPDAGGTVRRAGDAVAAVHGLRQRALGDAGRRAKPVSGTPPTRRRFTTSCSSCGRPSASLAD